MNVGRGALVDTGALVAALRAGRLRGALLDVTDPEPLPDGHPLWSEPRALITPHVANTRAQLDAALARAWRRTSRASVPARSCSARSIPLRGTDARESGGGGIRTLEATSAIA